MADIKTKELTDRTIAWLLKPKSGMPRRLNCSMVFTEVQLHKPRKFNEKIDILAFPKCYYISLPMLIEIKISRADFFNQKKKKLCTVNAIRYFVTPKNLLNLLKYLMAGD